MTHSAILISDAQEADLLAIRDLYAWHVQHGIASFETEPPSLNDIMGRYTAVKAQGLPWLAARQDGELLGYCYLSPYRPRYAYRFTVEDSVYIHPAKIGRGLGALLLREAITRAEQGGWRQMLAVIGNADNHASLRLHQKLGFQLIGQLTAVGYKHDRWVDTLLMQRSLGEGQQTPPRDG